MKTPSRKFVPSILTSPISSRLKPLSLLRAATALLAFPLYQSAQAASVTWTGASGGDWNTGSNWSALPGAADTAVFNSNLATVLNASGTDQSVGSISFDTNAGTESGSFTVGTTGGNKLILANAGTIQTLSTLAGTRKAIGINAPLVLTPASTSTSGTYTFANNSVDPTNTLSFGGAISASTTSGTETLNLNGANTGYNQISGVISNGLAAGGLALTKNGTGTWVLTGANTYTGQTNVANGTVTLDFSAAGAPVTNILALGAQNANGTLLMGNSASNATGGYQAPTLNLIGAAGTANTQAFTGTYVYYGANHVNLTPGASGGTLKAQFGYINGGGNNGGATLDIGLPSGASATTTNANSNGIITIAGLTVGGTTWATTGNSTVSTVTTLTGSNICTTTSASAPANGLQVSFSGNLLASGSINVGILQNATYYVVNSSGKQFQLAATPGGSPISLLSSTNNSTVNVESALTGLADGSYATSYAGAATSSNFDATTSGTFSSSLTGVNSLRFNAAASNTVTIGNTTGLFNSMSSSNGCGGILVTANVGAHTSVITGGFLTGQGRRAFDIIQNNTAGVLQIDSQISSYGGIGGNLNKSGSGTLLLTANNSYTASTWINEGTIVVTGGYTPSITLTGTATTGNNTLIVSSTTGLAIGESVTNASFLTGNTTYIVTAFLSSTSVQLSNPVPTGGSGSFVFAGLGPLGGSTSIVYVEPGCTLQIGNGGSTGTLYAGQNIVNNSGTVSFNRSDAGGIFGNVISGAGGVSQIGAGSTTFTGANTYTGPTVINSGTLQLGNGLTTGTIAAGSAVSGSTGATLAFNRSDTPIYSNAISGGLGVLQNGSGATILTGTSTYTGPTTVVSGTLQLGNSGATGSIASSSAVSGSTGATLAFNRTDAVTFANTIGGGLGVAQLGSGITALTGSNSYTGATTISGGTLQVGSGGTLGTGAVSNAATLAFNTAGNYTLAGGNLVTGTGAVILASGTVAAAANNQFNTTGALILGATNGTLNLVGLDLTNGNSTFGGLTVQTNATGTNTIAIGAGKTLTLGGSVVIGGTAGTTNLTVTGATGLLAINNAGGPTNANFYIGGGGTAKGTVDLSGLGSFTANLGTGIFGIGNGSANSGSYPFTLLLAGTSSITAAKVSVGAGFGNQTNNSAYTMALGSGTNAINTNDLYIGVYNGQGRGNTGTTLKFNSTTGLLTLRGLAGGSSRANVRIGEDLIGAAGDKSGGFFDLSQSTSTGLAGGNADLMIDTLTMATRFSGGGSTSNFTFKSGTMDVNTLLMSNAIGSVSVSSTLALNGGTVIFNNGITVGQATAASGTGSVATANFNVAGAAVTATPGIVMGNTLASGSGSIASNVTISAGSLALGGNISSSRAGAGTVTSTLTLSGGTLDMGARNIGDATNAISFVINPGTAATLQNVGAVNGTSGITMSGSGILTLAGTNSYTSATTASAGTLTPTLVTALPGYKSAGGVVFNGGVLDVKIGNGTSTGWSTAQVDALLANATLTGGALGIDTTNGDLTQWTAFTGGGNFGSIGLAKLGAGTLTLNHANTYTGATTILSGTLQIGDGSTDGSIDSSSGIVNKSALVYNVVGGGTYGNVISGAGILTKTGTGSLTLAAANTYTGATTINSGTLTLQGTSTSQGFAIASGAVLELAALSGTLDNATTVFSGSGTVLKTGSGVVQWGSGAATFALGSGAKIDVQAGTFYGCMNANEVWTNNKADLNVAAGAIFRGVEANVRVNTLSGSGTIMSGYNGNGYTNFTFGVDNGSGTFGGVLSDNSSTGNFVKSGTGTQILTGSNSFTGTTTVNSGTLQIGDGTSGALSGSSAVTVNGGATLALNLANGGTLGSQVYNWGGTVSLIASGTNTLSGYLGGSASGIMNQSGTGTTVITGNNQFFGLLNINAGAVQISSSNGAIDSTVNVNANNGLLFGVNALTVGGLSGSGNFALVNGTNAVALTASNAYSNTIYSGAMSGNGSLTKSGSCMLTLSGSSTYSGPTNVNGGVLAISAANNIGDGSVTNTLSFNGGTLESTGNTYDLGANRSITLNGAGTLQSDAGTLTVSGSIAGAQTLTVTGSGNVNISGIIATGAGSIVKSGAGTLILSNSNSYTGGTTIMSGSVQLGNNYGLGSTAGNLTLNGGTLDLNGYAGTVAALNGGAGTSITNSSATSGTATVTSGSFGGIISDGAGQTYFVKQGASTTVLTLTGNNTFTGFATIGSGTTVVSYIGNSGVAGNLGAALNSGTQPIQIKNGGWLSYTGAGETTDRNVLLYDGDGGIMAIASNGAGALSLSGTIFGRRANGTSGADWFVLGGTNTGANTVSGSIVEGTYNNFLSVSKQGPGTWVLSGTKAYKAVTDVQNGILQFDSIANTGTACALGLGSQPYAILPSVSKTTISNLGTAVIPYKIALGSGSTSGILQYTGTANGSSNRQFGLNGNGTVSTASAAGTLTLSGTVAPVVSSNVTLTLDANNAGVNTASGVIADLAGASTTASTTGSNNVAYVNVNSTAGFSIGQTLSTGTGLAANTVILGITSGTLFVSPNTSGTVVNGATITAGGAQMAVAKTGPGIWALSGSNTYSGGTTVSSGTLRIGNANALGTGGLVVNGGVVDLSGNSVSVPAFSGAGGSVTNTASGTSTLTTTVASGTTTFAGNIANGSGAVILTDSGAGTLILSGSLVMAGLNANAGVTQLTQSGSVAAVNVAAGATLSMAAHSGSTYNVLDVSSLTISGSASSLSAANNAAVESGAYAPVAPASQKNAGVLTDTGLAVAQAAAATSAIEPASPEAVPEPGILGMLLAGALGMFGFRRQRRNG